MDATVLLLLVCGWKLTEGSGNIGSDVTGDTLTTAMDVLIPTTSDHSGPHVSFKEMNTVCDYVRIQMFDVTTTSTETELARHVHSYQDGETGMATSKDTNTSRDFIEKERQDLYFLDERINSSQKDVLETICEYIERNEKVGYLAPNKTMQFVEALKEYVNRAKELNILNDKQNSSADDELTIKDINKFEDKLRSVLNTKYQLEYLFTLININTKFKSLNNFVLKNREEYGETNDVSLLEDNIEALKEIIQLLNEHIHVAKLLINFTETFNLTPAFPTDYTDELVDLEMWESELQNKSRRLVEYNELLKDENFRILLKYINPVTQSIIIIIGCLGNGVLLAVFSMHKDMRTPPNHMVLNLAVGDLLSLINNILIYNILDVSGGTWHHGLALCRFYRFVRHLCLGVTVYSIVVISVHRFFALRVFSKWHGFGCRLTKKYKSLLIIGFVWLLASIVALPRTVNAGVYNNKCLGNGLEDSEGYYRFVNSIDLVALCFVPLVIIAVLSGNTARKIIESLKDIPDETAGKQKVKQARLLSSNILISLVVVFAVCYVPYFLYTFLKAWFTLDLDKSTHHLIGFFTFSLIFANACFNPIAVYFASRKYRLHMNKYLLCKFRQQVNNDSRKISNEISATGEISNEIASTADTQI